MMDRSYNLSAVTCVLCGEAFTLPEEDEVDSNLPRVLLCGHIYCTSCLLSIQCDGIIRCPECGVKSAVPEGGVCGLQEDSRIIGLIYTAKMNKNKRMKNRKNKLPTSTDMNANTEDVEQPADIEKIEKMVDEALAQAAENLAQLEHVHETLTSGLAKQVKSERVRLEMEIHRAADKAELAVQKWREVQLNQLTKLKSQFSTSQAQLCGVEERIKALEIAMQKAREVRRSPFLEQYCTLDEILETLQAPVDDQSYMKCIDMGSGLSFVFQSEGVNQSLSLFLKMEVGSPKCLSESTPNGHQPDDSIRKSPGQDVKSRSKHSPPLIPKKPYSSQKQDQEKAAAKSVTPRSSTPCPRPRQRLNLPQRSSPAQLETPDVIVEELLDEQERALPLTGPELANDKWRIQRRRNNRFENKRNVIQWVVVTHIVTPSHFYVRYVAEKRENEALSKKINYFCCKDGCRFTSSDTLEKDSMVFVKWKKGLWYRARVVEVCQNGCVEAVKTCPVDLLASIRVFFLDYGLTKSISMQSEEETAQSSLAAVNNNLRKVDEVVKAELHHFAPQAIKCSLKDLVPYDLTKGWSKEALVEFHNVVGTAAVEMRPLGQDRDSILVDLRKSPMEQSSDVPISVREYLVFIEVARFYSPLTLGRKPLLYYPPVYPRKNTDVNAVVSHVNNPADFYIQLVENMESLLLSVKLQDCYNATTTAGEDDLSVYCPVIGQAYVARYDDKLWYRAQVIGHPGGRKVEVRYVDFGNKNIVSVSDLRKIKDEFFALPTMAIRCCLSDLIPFDGVTWSESCTNRFISLAHQKLVTLVAVGKGAICQTEPLPVKLFESGLNGPLANIAELLVKEGLARFKEGFAILRGVPKVLLLLRDVSEDAQEHPLWEGSKILKPKDVIPAASESVIWDPPLELGLAKEDAEASNQKISDEQKEELLEFQPMLKLPAKLKDLKVRVCHVNSPSSFYVQLTQYNTQLKRMCELLKEECANAEPQDVVWKADMHCGADINGVWERGQICTDVTSSNIAEVMRCDHGNTVKLHVNNLRPLPSTLIGSFVLECTLSGIRPAGGQSTWTNTACDLFSHYLTGASAVMTIKEFTDKRPVPVILCCSNKMGQFVSIADFLVSEGLALRERKPKPVDAVVEKPKETVELSQVTEAHADDDDKRNTPSTPTLDAVPSPPPLSSTRTCPKPAPRTIMSAEKVMTPLYNPPELPCLGHIQISVSAIGDDGLIYVRTQNAVCQLEQLKKRIQQSMKTLPNLKPYTWKSVLGCAVIGPDMLWYRGELLEVLGEHVKVQYVDCGLVENIPVVHVYPVLLCEDVPQLCMPCQLHSISPVGGTWQRDAIALLREMLLNRCAELEVMKLPADPRGVLTVELFLNGLSLSKILCHHKHASMDRTGSGQKGHSVMSPAFLDDWDINTEGLRGPEEPILGAFVYPKLPKEGERFQVRVKHLLTPNELFLWPLDGSADVEVDGETFDEALARINSNISSLLKLTNFSAGSPCLAEYSDGKYYRAKLIKFISVEPVMILVHHVDFGSDDTLPTSKIRQMPPELLRFPLRALKVKVAGFKAPSINTQEDVLPYSPEWSVKAAMEMMDLLHTNITTSVVACEPELTVLLYDESGQLVHLPLVSSGLAELE